MIDEIIVICIGFAGKILIWLFFLRQILVIGLLGILALGILSCAACIILALVNLAANCREEVRQILYSLRRS